MFKACSMYVSHNNNNNNNNNNYYYYYYCIYLALTVSALYSIALLK